MKNLLFVFFLLPALPGYSQLLHAVDAVSLNTPDRQEQPISELAQQLSKGAGSDTEKLRAIYTWVTHHIRYKDNNLSSDFWASPEYIEEQRAEQVLRNRTATCQGYANLFCALAKELGISAEVVTGIVKESRGNIPRLGHAWVAAKADSNWYLFDPTWGVPQPGGGAYSAQERYFMMPPEQFVLNHLPDDPAWQLLEKPVGERLFRASSAAEISDYLNAPAAEKFMYRDTLAAWLAMDSVHRMLDMENRVLQFNGSNERAVFSLSQNYWGLFYDLHYLLDSLADETIMHDTIQLDPDWFLTQTAMLEKYHSRARALSDRLESPERRQRAEKFYTPGDVAALLHKLEGSLWTGRFEKIYRSHKDLPREQQLTELRTLMARADSAYESAANTVNCEKMYTLCLEIWHNQSLAHIQFAQREVYLIEQILADKQLAPIQDVLPAMAAEAQALFRQAAAEVHKMTLRPPIFALTRERQTSIRQGLFNLRAHTLRARRATMMPAVEETIGNPSFSVQQSETLLKKLTDMQSELYQFVDSVENSGAALDKDFTQNLLFNLQYETFTLQYSLGSLHYRKAWHLGQQARQNKPSPQEKVKILTATNEVLSAIREANEALNALARSGHLSNAHIAQRRQQVEKLKDAARQLLEAM